MPEGPEVRIIGEALRKEVVGYYLQSIEISEKSRYAKKALLGLDQLDSKLPRKIEDVFTKGKKIVFDLPVPIQDDEKEEDIESLEEDRIFLISFLAMEGKWSWMAEKHSDLWFNLYKEENGNVEYRTLYFTDSRHFGSLEIIYGLDAIYKRLNEIGPDLLSDEIEVSEWRSKIRSGRIKNKKIGIFVMEQQRFSGIGNYLRAEILYAARISPHRKLCDLNNEEVDRLFVVARQIIWKAYEKQGYTLASFSDFYGKKGGFQVKVYGKLEDPDGNQVVAEDIGDKRTTHWVPKIQL